MRAHLILACIFILTVGCANTYPNRNPVGEMFPDVSGQSLKKESRRLPGHFHGSNVLFILGYKQDSQFDIDRWLIGLDQTRTEVTAYEIPTIEGLFPRMFQTMIDDGMRSGIPKELWGGVITVYKDGGKVQRFTGNEKPNNARVVLLDKNGKVSYFYDRGFSVFALNDLRARLAQFANKKITSNQEE